MCPPKRKNFETTELFYDAWARYRLYQHIHMAMTMNVLGVVTGRMSSRDPAFSQSPKKGKFEGVNTMGVHTLVCKFKNDVSTRGMYAGHKSPKSYHYLTMRDDIVAGDSVVVRVPEGDLKVVEVQDVLYHTKTASSYKYIIDKVDFTEHNRQMELLQAEETLRRQREQRKRDLLMGIEDRRKAVEQQVIDERLKADPEYLRMQSELSSLQNLDQQ